MNEQTRSAQMIRKYLKESKMYNPFDNTKEVDNILKKYGKGFWG